MKTHMLLAQALVVLSVFGSSAHAAEETAVVVAPQPVVYQDSSEFHRMNKKFMGVVQPFGAGPNNYTSQGLMGGVFLQRNTIATLEYTGNGSNRNYGSFSSNYSIDTASYGAHLKQFLGNSFYVKGGIDYRTVKYRYNYTSSLGSQYNEYRSFDSTSWAASLAIGNQWQFENLTLGCDWIGFVAPFSSTVTNESNDRGALTYASYSGLGSDRDRLTKETVAQGLRFYIGASF